VTTRFLDCELDHGARLLRRAGAPVHLTPKAIDVLLLLLARRPDAVAKAEILEQVWPGTFVTDASLARTVHEIRDAIGAGGPAAVRTVHGYGYAFQAAAVSAEIPAVDSEGGPSVRGWLIVGGRALPLRDGTMLIGRDPAAAIPVESRLASWHHARLVVTAERVAIEDLGSKNGTAVRGEPVEGVRTLSDDDDVIVGDVRFLFRSGEQVVPTLTAPD
jgi:DNA-binding winged helix-turn-helix (wHTH) protein